MTHPSIRLALITYLTDDYDAAIAWFQSVLGFVLLEDTDMGGGKRWVRMAPHPEAETAFLIAKLSEIRPIASEDKLAAALGIFCSQMISTESTHRCKTRA